MSTTEAPAVEETVSAHAMRVLRARLRAAAAGALDPCIAFLQRLRSSAGGAQNAEGAEDGSKSKRDRSGGRRDDAKDAEAAAPKPGGRLLARLVNLAMLLVGCAGGGALAYQLLEDMLDQKTEENIRIGATIAEHSRSAATAQEQLAEAQEALKETKKKLEGTAVAAAEKKLEEAQARRAELEKKLEDEQAKRAEAEKKLQATTAEYRTTATEKQARLDEAVKLLATLAIVERTGKTQPPAGSGNAASAGVPGSTSIAGAPGAAGKAGSKPRPLKSGNCDFKGGNAAALKDCIADFNR